MGTTNVGKRKYIKRDPTKSHGLENLKSFTAPDTAGGTVTFPAFKIKPDALSLFEGGAKACNTHRAILARMAIDYVAHLPVEQQSALLADYMAKHSTN